MPSPCLAGIVGGWPAWGRAGVVHGAIKVNSNALWGVGQPGVKGEQQTLNNQVMAINFPTLCQMKIPCEPLQRWSPRVLLGECGRFSWHLQATPGAHTFSLTRPTGNMATATAHGKGVTGLRMGLSGAAAMPRTVLLDAAGPFAFATRRRIQPFQPAKTVQRCRH